MSFALRRSHIARSPVASRSIVAARSYASQIPVDQAKPTDEATGAIRDDSASSMNVNGASGSPSSFSDADAPPIQKRSLAFPHIPMYILGGLFASYCGYQYFTTVGTVTQQHARRQEIKDTPLRSKEDKLASANAK